MQANQPTGHFQLGFVLLASASVGVGVATSYFGATALLALLGAAALPLLVHQPFWGLLLLAATIPLENLAMFAEGITVSRVIGLALAGGWLCGKVLRNESFNRVLTSPALWLSGAFAGLVMLSFLWATNTAVVRAGFIQLLQLAALAVIAFDLVDSRTKLQAVLRTLVVSGLVAAGLTLYESITGGSYRAGAQVLGGVNETGAMLVTLTPIAFYLLISERNPFWHLVGVAFIAAGPGAVIGTMSRASMILLPVVLLIMALHNFASRKARLWVMIGFVGVGFGVMSQQDLFSRLERRLESVAPYLDQAIQPEQAGGLSGRGYHVVVGLAIFRDHPWLGVGYNNYGHVFIYRYQFSVPGAARLYRSHRDPHSSIVGILADLGLIGGFLWLSLLSIVLLETWRALRLSRVVTPRRPLPAFALLVCLLLQAGPYALYYPNQKTKLLWLLIGLALAMSELARMEQNEVVRDRETVDDPIWSRVDLASPAPVGSLVPVGPSHHGSEVSLR